MPRQNRQEMDRLVAEAGFGTATLSKPGLWVARNHDWVLAALVALSGSMAAWASGEYLALGVAVAGYLLWVALRRRAKSLARERFYHPLMQLARGQLGIAAVTALLVAAGPRSGALGLWALYLLVLLAISKHAGTVAFLALLADASAP